MNVFYTRVLALVFSVFVFSETLAQADTLGPCSEKHATKNGIWFTPSLADNINGIAIGPFESVLFFDQYQKINGLTIVLIGAGLLVPVIPYDPFDEYFQENRDSDSVICSRLDNDIERDRFTTTTHNGLVLSMAGTMTGDINGVTLSFWCGGAGVLNGLSVNPFINLNQQINGVAVGGINSAGKVRGLQVGLYNRAVNLKGLQIGLINRSRKRTLPFFNWG